MDGNGRGIGPAMAECWPFAYLTWVNTNIYTYRNTTLNTNTNTNAKMSINQGSRMDGIGRELVPLLQNDGSLPT